MKFSTKYINENGVMFRRPGSPAGKSLATLNSTWALWWNSNAPLARVMLLPLLGSVFVVYFFWNGRKWAWVLLMASVMVELSIVLFGFASLRAHLTGPELFALALRVALDVYFLWFSSRPDTASFFERRSGRVGGGR